MLVGGGLVGGGLGFVDSGGMGLCGEGGLVDGGGTRWCGKGDWLMAEGLVG